MIYFDHNASTPVRPEARAAMEAALADLSANPSSTHREGQRARAAIEHARAQVAALVGAAPEMVTFVSGGTEGDHAALIGAAWAAEPRGRRVAFSAIEHHAVHGAAEVLARTGFAIGHLGVGREGLVDPAAVAALPPDTTVVAVMLANNETGVIQPLAAIAAAAAARGMRVVCDAVQAAGKIPVDVRALDVDTLALSGHKIYGPKGVGALYIKRGTRLKAFVRGGSQERNRRAGTENVAGIVGLGRAAELARDDMGAESARLSGLRDRLESQLLATPGAQRNGEAPRVPNTANVSFSGVEAESLVMALDLAGVAVSTGAACAAGAVEPSHVLRAMGLPLERVQASLRFSLGRGTTAEDVDAAAKLVAEAVDKQRKSSRAYASKS